MTTTDFLHLKIDYTSQRKLVLPTHPGSAWRGAFGHSLKETACLQPQNECHQCHLRTSCSYSYIFETATSADDSAHGITTNAPHPYVFSPSINTDSSATCQHSISLSLIGNAITHLPTVLYAMRQAGLRGIGKSDNQLTLDKTYYFDGRAWQPLEQIMHQAAPPRCNTPDMPTSPVTLELISPLRLKHRGNLVTPEKLTPQIFVRALLTRLHDLSAFHQPESAGDYPKELLQRAANLNFSHRDLRWDERQRHSSRQNRKHHIGGIVGHVTLDIAGLDALWPMLWSGQYLHLGKLATMGHGAYRINSQACQSPSVNNEKTTIQTNHAYKNVLHSHRDHP